MPVPSLDPRRRCALGAGLTSSGSGARLALGLAVAAWLAVALLTVTRIPWLLDDGCFLASGPGASPAYALPRLWTTQYWALSTDPHGSLMYRPILVLSYVVDGLLWGPDPRWSHAANVIIHLVTVAGVAQLARRAGDAPWPAAALVLVHPLAAELLGVVTNRSDLLATALVTWSIAVRRPGPRGFGADLLVVLAAGTKEIAYVAPALSWLEARRRGEARWGRDFGRPALAVGLVVGIRTALLGLSGARPAPFDLVGALAGSGWAMLDLAAPVPAGVWPAAHEPIPGLLLLVVLALASRWTWYPAGWVLAASALVVGWLPFEVRPARGLLYLSLVGPALFFGAVVARGSRPTRLAWGALLAGLAAMQLWQLQLYRDPLRLWTWSAERNPDAVIPVIELARLAAPGHPAQAEALYRRAAGLAMQQADGFHFRSAAMALARLALSRGSPGEARAYLEDIVARVGPEDGADAVELLAHLPPPD